MPGKATFQLLRMVREELVLELRAAVNKARKTGTSVRKEAVRVGENGDLRLVNIEVRPLPARTGGNRYFLILFENAPAESSGDSAERQPPAATADRHLKKGRDKELAEVKNDLVRTRDYLQAIIQEHETTNEELKASNEEAQSSMEELHSTNEELETAKEELQSSNEELVTLNEQLQKRNTELARLSDELSNVLTGVDIPILILGADLRIRRFTPVAEKLLRLLPGDVGRPLSHIRIGINLPDLEESIAQVTKGVRDVWREVQADDGRWYSVRILPFLTAERKIDGALIVFVDVNDLKQINQKEQQEQKLIAGILDAARDLLVIVLDGAGTYPSVQSRRSGADGVFAGRGEGKTALGFPSGPGGKGSGEKRLRRQRSRAARRTRKTHWLTKRGQPRLIAVVEHGRGDGRRNSGLRDSYGRGRHGPGTSAGTGAGQRRGRSNPPRNGAGCGSGARQQRTDRLRESSGRGHLRVQARGVGRPASCDADSETLPAAACETGEASSSWSRPRVPWALASTFLGCARMGRSFRPISV